VTLHEIVGPVLASVAIILTISLFKRTLDFQAYREIDSNYMEVLKIGIENPYLRDISWIKNHVKNLELLTNAEENRLEQDKAQKYEQYALMVWNIIETIYDRNKVDRTWRPIIEAEKHLHGQWFTENKNKYFKSKFIKFVEDFAYDIRQEPSRWELAIVVIYKVIRRTPQLKPNAGPDLKKENKVAKSAKIKDAELYLNNKKKAALPILAIAGILVGAIAIIIITYEFTPEWFGQIENFESHVELDCARNYNAFNVSHPYDCSKFSPGTLAELCVNDLQTFNVTDQAECSKFIEPTTASS
jgi:hypothetical protein